MLKTLFWFFARFYLLASFCITLTGEGRGLAPSPPGIHITEVGDDSLLLEFRLPEDAATAELLSVDAWKIRGVALTNEIGKPALPGVSTLVGIPPSGNFKLEITLDDSLPLPGETIVLPVGRPSSPVDDLQGGEWISVKDEDFYRQNEWYPPEAAHLSGEAWARDQRIARVTFYPFQYNPQQNRFIVHHRVQARIYFQGSDENPTPAAQNGARSQEEVVGAPEDLTFEAGLRGALLNYDQAVKWRRAPGDHLEQILEVDDVQVSGPRYKIVVDRDGLYRLDYDDLKMAGVPVGAGGIDPHSFHLTSQGQDVAILVAGEEDYQFNPGDTLTFYGQKFRGSRFAQRYQGENRHWLTYIQQTSDGNTVSWHPEHNAVMAEKYTDENIYWLTAGGVPGPRMSAFDGDPRGSQAETISSYRENLHAEKSLIRWTWHFQGEDTWFWERMQGPGSWSFPTTLTAPAVSSIPATVRARIGAAFSNDYASPDHHTLFRLNQRAIPLDEAYWDGKSSYTFETQVLQTDLIDGENWLIFTAIHDTATHPTLAYPDYFFDWFEIEYQREFQAVAGELIFSVAQEGTYRYELSGFPSSPVEVFDVTDPLSPVRITNTLPGGAPGNHTVQFVSGAGIGARFYAASLEGVKKPKSISYYQPPDLRSGANGADYLIISAPDFIPGLQELAVYRASLGLRTRVIDIGDVYNEFSDGIVHPIAIKNFLAYTFAHWQPPAPSYVLLVGDGHWNVKGANPQRYGKDPVFLPPYLGWVDLWQGEIDATNLLGAIVGQDPLPDLHIGRLPVNSSTELKSVVEKILAYERAAPRAWQERVLFVADDTPDQAGDFVAQSEALIDGFLTPPWTAGRIYLDDYEDGGLCGIPAPGGPSCPAVNLAIQEDLNETGALLLTYFGHASISAWANERIFDAPGIQALANPDRLPVLLSMTCLDGTWFGPTGGSVSFGPGLAESLLRANGKGVVGAFSPGGLGVGTGHDALAEGFYRALFVQHAWELGEAASSAMLTLYSTGADLDLLSSFVVLGDPALRLITPANREPVYLPAVVK